MRAASLVVVVCLALALGAPVASAQTPQGSVLQQLTRDVSTQIDLRYPLPSGEKQARRDRLAEAIALWNASQKNDDDARIMERWLLDALRSSMAGSKEPMPSPPEFAVRPKPVAPPVAQLGPPTPAPQPRRVVEPLEFVPAPVSPKSTTSPIDGERPTIAATQHPATARLDWSAPFQDDPFRDDAILIDPFLDDPAPLNAAPSVGTASREQRRKPTLPSEPRGSVELKELSARVRGLSRGVSAIDARLSDRRPPSAFELAGLVRDLEQLSREDRFLGLYLNGLTAVESREVGRRPDVAQTIAMLIDQVGKRQAELDQLRGEQSVAERDILTALVVKLDEIRSGGS